MKTAETTVLFRPSKALLDAIAEASAAYKAKLAAAELTAEAKHYAELKERVRILYAEHNAATTPSLAIEAASK